MSDITAGPDMFSRILAANHDEDNAGHRRNLEVVARGGIGKLVAARLEARKTRPQGQRQSRKDHAHVLTITETVTPGNGDKARLEDPSFEFVSKMSKPAPIKGRGRGWTAKVTKLDGSKSKWALWWSKAKKSTAKAEKRKAM